MNTNAQSKVNTNRPLELEYAQVGEIPLMLDVYLSSNATSPALIVWIHGGAWRSGSRKPVAIQGLLDKGWNIASVDYRLSPQGPFPAQCHDIKAAIRFLRANTQKLPYDASKIAVIGASAGGHLAAIVGTTNHHKILEGNVGNNLDEDSSVQAIVSYYGASNLTTILDQSTEFGLKVRVPALDLFIGGDPKDNLELAKLASPVYHLDSNDPPLLLIHGDLDPQMPPQQSEEFQNAYDAQELDCEYHILKRSKHGGPEFFNDAHLTLIDSFLRERL